MSPDERRLDAAWREVNARLIAELAEAGYVVVRASSLATKQPPVYGGGDPRGSDQ